MQPEQVLRTGGSLWWARALVIAMLLLTCAPGGITVNIGPEGGFFHIAGSWRSETKALSTLARLTAGCLKLPMANWGYDGNGRIHRERADDRQEHLNYLRHREQ